MQEYAPVIQAIASLLWPLFAFTALFLFRVQIIDLVKRLKKGRLFGQEIELSESLDRLTQVAESVKKEGGVLPNTSPPERSLKETADEEDVVRKIVSEAAQSPKAALISLASELEKLAREVLAATGHLNGRRMVSVQQSINELHQDYGLPSHVPSSLKYFMDVRNRLIHRGEGTNEDILRAIDSGISILKALQAMPREVNVVHQVAVALFTDPALTVPMTTVSGVILETHSPGGTSKVFRIFPTTRTHFVAGKRVSWEWNLGLVVGTAWYLNPETGVATEAWRGSAEFIGRHLDEL